MRYSTLTLATMLAASSDLSLGQAADSKYTYAPGGVTFNGKFLPGPEQWEGQCNDGSVEQTPIAITTADWSAETQITTADYTFNAGTCSFSDLTYAIKDNGLKAFFDASVCTPPSVTIPDDPTLSVSLGLGGLGGVGVTIGDTIFGPEAGKTYNAAQFHIHSSSEHTIDGETFEAEMHIVHLKDDSEDEEARAASVVGFMIKSDASSTNAIFENLLLGWEDLGCGVTSAQVDASIVTSSAFNPYDFLDPNTCIMNYDGGLTTPTCDEIVEWNLATTPISITSSQMARALTLINDCPESISFQGSTSRPVQPLNGRTVNQICPEQRRNLRA